MFKKEMGIVKLEHPRALTLERMMMMMMMIMMMEEEEEKMMVIVMMVMKLLTCKNCKQISDFALFVFQNASHCILGMILSTVMIYLTILHHLGFLHVISGIENKVMVSLLFCV
jgi:hypothetical protein